MKRVNIILNYFKMIIDEGRKDYELICQAPQAFSESSNISSVEEQEQYLSRWARLYRDANKSFRNSFSEYNMAYLRNPGLKDAVREFIHKYEAISQEVSDYKNRELLKKGNDVFKTIGLVEGHNLDRQQLFCIAKDAHSHLVIAGAGTGKTTTIVGYIKYLLLSGICKNEDLLLLSFTKASSAEMAKRIKTETKANLDVFTFHKLGMNIITAVQGVKPRVAQIDLRGFSRQQLDLLIHKDGYLKKLCVYLTFMANIQKTEFDFSDENEYKKYLKANPPVTMKKENVKSYGEMDIANFLFQNNIKYIYEADYPIDTRTSEYGQYHPDFYLPEYNIYIEYFGCMRNGEVPPFFSGKNGLSPSETYKAGIQWKRELHKKYGTVIIETYAYERAEETLLSNLSAQLHKYGVTFSEMPTQELWNEIADKKGQTLDRIAELYATVISLAKSNECTIQDIRERNKKLDNLSSIGIILDLIEPVYNAYQAELAKNEEIDFNDMINLAAEYVRNGKFHHHYKYVVIDEYQDISQSRYRLLDAMRQQSDYNLFCVGDDWQSIYRFSGSDIGLFLEFEKYWGKSEFSHIERTYRFDENLIHVSGSFIMKNPEQIKKRLESACFTEHFSIERINGYTEEMMLKFLAERLNNDFPENSDVLFLGRYRFDVKILNLVPEFKYYYDNQGKTVKITYAKRPDLNMNFMTVHSAKGLQADHVVLLNTKKYGMGFPSNITDSPVLRLLLDNCSTYPYAEERRLFYVALTRAKKKVWLLTLDKNVSEFVEEIEEMCGDKMREEQYTCPLCGGRLVRRKGKNGVFFGCSNYRILGCKYTRNIVRASENSRSKNS